MNKPLKTALAVAVGLAGTIVTVPDTAAAAPQHPLLVSHQVALSKRVSCQTRTVVGPGSSHQDASKPRAEERSGPTPGSPTNDTRLHVSGGGGERDRIPEPLPPAERGQQLEAGEKRASDDHRTHVRMRW